MCVCVYLMKHFHIIFSPSYIGMIISHRIISQVETVFKKMASHSGFQRDSTKLLAFRSYLVLSL